MFLLSRTRPLPLKYTMHDQFNLVCRFIQTNVRPSVICRFVLLVSISFPCPLISEWHFCPRLEFSCIFKIFTAVTLLHLIAQHTFFSQNWIFFSWQTRQWKACCYQSFWTSHIAFILFCFEMYFVLNLFFEWVC